MGEGTRGPLLQGAGEGTWGCGRGARTERGAGDGGGRAVLVSQPVPALPYDCLPTSVGEDDG